MSDIFFTELEVPNPDYFLGVHSGTHGFQTGQMLKLVEQVLLSVKPDTVLVYGDTNSTLAGALAAAKLHIPVIHIEAGLRSYNRKMPEEINRILTDHCSDYHFVPSKAAMANLRREGVSENTIFNVGDVMYDAALYYGQKAEKESDILSRIGIEPERYALATVHRAENTENMDRLLAIFDGLCKIGREIRLVLPLHPRTRKVLQENQLIQKVEKDITVIDPVGYLDMIMLEKKASFIATDSGGVQKEAFFYKVPCATLRSETEWIELVELGWNRVVNPLSSHNVYHGILNTIGSIGSTGQPYGNGEAVRKITNIIRKIFS